jgi:2-methylisocitrate lyase-like PEP mutase family enzyme
MLDEVIARGRAYADVGADGFFVPGLTDIGMIKTLCNAIELPINIIAVPDSPENKMLALAGVARISYGGTVYKQMFEWLGEQAKATFASLEG